MQILNKLAQKNNTVNRLSIGEADKKLPLTFNIKSPLKVYPELSRTSLSSKQDKELCLWYELRLLNSTGSSRIPREHAVQALMDYFNYSHSTINRILKAGQGVFWTCFNNWLGIPVIQIYSLAHIVGYMDIHHEKAPILVDVEQWKQSRHSRRSFLHAVCHRVPGKRPINPISRASIEEATGINPRQQQRYEHTAGVKVIENKVHGQKMVVAGKSREHTITRQLPNTYYLQAVKGHIGMVKAINKGLHEERSLGSDEATSKRKPRRYFTSVKQCVRCQNRDAEHFLSVKGKWQPLYFNGQLQEAKIYAN